MNLAVRPDVHSEDEETISGLTDLLRGGFENPEGLRGRVRISFPERETHDFVAVMSEVLTFEQPSTGGPADATATIPLATARRIVSECEQLDWRDPSVIGTIGISGNLALVRHLAGCCMRPDAWTVARFRRAARRHAAGNFKHMRSVTYLHQPTQRKVLEAMEEGLPVVITGLEPDPPCRHWTIDLLAERYGDAIVRVRSATEHESLAAFVQSLKSSGINSQNPGSPDFVKPYTGGTVLPEVMWPDFGPLFFGREDFIAPQLWLGSVPTHLPATGLHRDPLTGFLFQVIGRKRLDLYSADQAELLYPMKSYNLFQPCWFKPEAPDYALFPKAREACRITVTLNPGELLIQPWGWFHQVHALDSPNMSVSYFWRY